MPSPTPTSAATTPLTPPDERKNCKKSFSLSNGQGQSTLTVTKDSTIGLQRNWRVTPKVETKDGAESVYRHNLSKATSFGANDPLVTAFGSPNIYRVDPGLVRLTALTEGECDQVVTPPTTGAAPAPGGQSGTSGVAPTSLIGGPWVTPTGDVIDLNQKGNRINGSYSGILGSGEITGTFDGKNLKGRYTSGQSLMPFEVPFELTLLEDGRLVGRLETPLGSTPLSLTKRRQ